MIRLEVGETIPAAKNSNDSLTVVNNLPCFSRIIVVYSCCFRAFQPRKKKEVNIFFPFFFFSSS